VTCLSAEEMAALFDGRLPRPRAAQGRAHVAECPRCAGEIRRLSEVLRDAERLDTPRPSAALLAQAVALGQATLRPASAELSARPDATDGRPAPHERK
jgi:hypothetical protein